MVWFNDLEELGQVKDRKGFTKALLVRFRPSSYDDLMESLTKLKQSGAVEEFKANFEALSNRLRGLFESLLTI